MAMIDLFRRSSREAGALADADPALDVVFYRSFYADLAGFGDAAAAAHWRRHGRREHRFPSAQAAVLGHPNYLRLPDDFDPTDYVFVNRDLPAEYFDAFKATMHFLVFGLGEARQYRSFKTDDAFLAALAAATAPTPLSKADRRLAWLPRGMEQYLYVRGFGNADFLADFDAEFYAATNGLDANAPLQACVIHFGEGGVDRLRPIGERLVFDPLYYRKLVRTSYGQGLAQASDAELYRQWLAKRDYAVHPASHGQKLLESFGVSRPTPAEIDLDVYRHANDDLRTLDDEALLEQLFSHGLLEKRSSIRIDRSNVMLFTRCADHLQQQGRLAEAEQVYFRLAHFVPDFAGLNQRLGDYLVRQERFAEAFVCYRRNIDRGQASKWGFLNAAMCSDRLNDLASALAIVDQGCRAYPDDQHFVRQRQSYAERFFEDEFAYARAVGAAGRVADAQAALARAAGACDFPPDSEAPAQAIRNIALFANTDLVQCTLYRVEQKAEQIVAAGFGVTIFDWNTDREAFARSLSDFELVIFYRVAALPPITRLINAARAAGLVTVYEIDDLIFDAAEFPEPLDDYAGQITPAHHVSLCLGTPLFRRAMEACDYALASTPALARHMEGLVRRKRAFVHRNALGLRHERASARPAPRASDGRVTIFYGSGTKAHKGDFETILLPALEEVDRRFGDAVRFVFAGHRPVTASGTVLDKVRFVPFTPEVEDYWDALSAADISLSVLRRTPATDAKSEIKWLEAAMFGIPSVVSATQTFSEVIEDGVDGLLAAGTSDFAEHISTLVRDAPRRAAMGAAARVKAFRDYGLDALAANLGTMVAALAPPPAPERTRVLVVNVFYPPQTKGGATRVVVDNIADLRELYPDEFEFEVFTTLEGGQTPYEVHVYADEGIRVTAMTAGDDPDVDRIPIDPRAGELFRQRVERFDPHLIHFHCIQRISAAAAEVALLAKVPYLITAHDAWWISDRQFLYDRDGPAPSYDFERLSRYRVAAEQGTRDRPLRLHAALRGADAILAVSEPFAEVYRRTGLTNVRALPNGMPRVSAGAGAIQRRGGDGRVRIAHIGGTSVHKGYQLLKHAVFAAKPANLSVTVVELGLEVGEELAEDWNGTPVRIVAKRRQSEVNALYAEIDVLFAPSLWPESYGLVTREAVAAGCWVVASDRGAVAEPVVEGVNGHVISVDTIDGLVAVLGLIDADPARYRARPPAQPAQRTSRDQARELATLYREVARPRRGSPAADGA